jgi:hypothetical protein
MTQGEALLVLVRATAKAAFAGAFADREVKERDAIEEALSVCASIANAVLDQEQAAKEAKAAEAKETQEPPKE